MKAAFPLLVAGAMALLTFACSSPRAYYKVTDTTTGKIYWTEEMYQEQGVTHLKDGKTGDDVTLQNTEVRAIPKEEFEVKRLQP